MSDAIRAAAFWDRVLASAELGRHLSDMRLADGIVAHGVSAAGAEANYVAERLLGRVHGVPPGPDAEDGWDPDLDILGKQ